MLYVIKEKTNEKNINNNISEIIFSKSFTEYFNKYLNNTNINKNNIRNNRDRKVSLTGKPDKQQLKNKILNKQENTDNNNNNLKEEIYLKTDNNKDDSGSEYEFKIVEQLKKTKNAKIIKKPLNMSIWISDEIPIKLSHFIPLIHILSFTSSEFSQLKSTLCSSYLPFESFPLKISFPIGLSFYALLTVTDFSQEKIDQSIFDINYETKLEEINGEKLDDKYANDFYEKYYTEKNKNKNKKNKSKKKFKTQTESNEDDNSFFIKEINNSNDIFKEENIFNESIEIENGATKNDKIKDENNFNKDENIDLIEDSYFNDLIGK
jgi:hypothetical protein